MHVAHIGQERSNMLGAFGTHRAEARRMGRETGVVTQVLKDERATNTRRRPTAPGTGCCPSRLTPCTAAIQPTANSHRAAFMTRPYEHSSSSNSVCTATLRGGHMSMRARRQDRLQRSETRLRGSRAGGSHRRLPPARECRPAHSRRHPTRRPTKCMLRAHRVP
jgi:hypothetical protein